MNGKTWTEQERIQLRKLFADNPSKIVAEKLNRSLSSIHAQANLLGLKKSELYLQTESSGRIQKGMAISPNTQFKKGIAPHNKGTKGVMKANKTSFKKGQTPTNYKPIGSERVNVEGYTEVKIKNPNKWALKHRLVWMEHNGQIPRGHVIIFNDNDKLNFDIKNLRMITLQENMKRNSIQRFPKELISTIKTISKLKKQITNYGTQQN